MISKLATCLAASIAFCGIAAAEEVAQSKSEIVAKLPFSVGNIAFTPDNQLIFSHHPFYSPDVRVGKLTSETTFEPFPNAEWNTPREGTDHYLDNVLGLRSDEDGVVWIIDMGFRTGITPKLVGWNTRTDSLERIYYMPKPATRDGSQPQDIVIDRKHGKFYIADEDIGPGGDGSQAAIIVIDMKSGIARRVLEGDASTVPEDVPITVDGKDLTVPGSDGKPAIIKVGCDGITMDVNSEWVYYAPLSGGAVYRIKAADLADESISAADLEQEGRAVCRQAQQWRPVHRLSGQSLPDGRGDQGSRRHHDRQEVPRHRDRSRDGMARRHHLVARRIHVCLGLAGVGRRDVP